MLQMTWLSIALLDYCACVFSFLCLIKAETKRKFCFAFVYFFVDSGLYYIGIGLLAVDDRTLRTYYFSSSQFLFFQFIDFYTAQTF